MNRNRAGIACIIVGAVLSISALLLLLYNRNEDNRAGQAAQMLLPDVQNAISQNIKESRGDSEDMTEMEIDGYGYIGYLSILPLELELPVISEWDGDYNRLQIAPCRQFGSTRSDDLVIAGHNYNNHFGRLPDLTEGDQVKFTDMDGEVSTYEVASIGVIASTDIEAVQDSEYDLVMYTCTYSGQDRVMVGCKRIL